MSTTTGQTFTIRYVSDFLRVPVDRRTQCLTEFLGWLAHVEQARLRDAPVDVGPFIWADDGVGGVREVHEGRKGGRVLLPGMRA